MTTAEDAQQRRIALLLEYEGTRYAGSQFQTNAPTIQGEVEAAILKTTGEQVRAAFAGRTDAGVHALGQVACFPTMSGLPAATVVDALNAWLPPDIAVRAARDVDGGFDPRRQALWRRYRYVVENRRVRPALTRELSWHVKQPLDVEAMQDAASTLVGEHDFAAFAAPLDDPSASTVRDLQSFTVERKGTRVLFEVAANAFLPHQVRRMVGALVQVGQGKITGPSFAELLGGPPSSAGPAAPARGLFLVRVHYESPLFEAGVEG